MAPFFNKKNLFFLTLLVGFFLSVSISLYLGNSVLDLPNFNHSKKLKNNSQIQFAINRIYNPDKRLICQFNFPSDCFIQYTTDGSDPSINGKKLLGNQLQANALPAVIPQLGSYVNSLHWRPGILDWNVRLVRAICIKPSKLEVSNEQQLILTNESNTKNNLPIVSICFDASSYSDFFSGIGVLGFSQHYTPLKAWWDQLGNFSYRGKKNKKESTFSIFNYPNSINSAYGEFAISGNASRAFPKKSYSFEFKSSSPFSGVKLINNNEICSAIILRSGSNDWNKAIIRDAYAEDLAQSIFKQDSRGVMPAILFLNGEYFGLYFVYPKLNKTTLANKYKVSEGDVLFWEEGNFKNDFSQKEINILQDKLRSNKINVKDKIRIIEEEIDLINFYRYVAFNQFLSNVDWPLGNNKMFKIKNQTKWKFVSNDLDISMGVVDVETDANLDCFKNFQESNSIVPTLFITLMKDSTKKNEFLNVFSELLKNNLSERIALNKLDQLITRVRPHVLDHTLRWRSHSSVKEWEIQIQKIRRFIHLRSEFLEEYIIDERSASK